MRKFLMVLGLLGIVAVAVVIVRNKKAEDDYSVSGAESFDANN